MTEFVRQGSIIKNIEEIMICLECGKKIEDSTEDEKIWCSWCNDWAKTEAEKPLGRENLNVADPPQSDNEKTKRSFWSWLFGREKQSSEPFSTASSGEFIKENPWGVNEGMSVKQVDKILAKNGFQTESVELPNQFGADPTGYQYPCWKNTQKGISVTSTFKNGKLLEFSWW